MCKKFREITHIETNETFHLIFTHEMIFDGGNDTQKLLIPSDKIQPKVPFMPSFHVQGETPDCVSRFYSSFSIRV